MMQTLTLRSFVVYKSLDRVVLLIVYISKQLL